MCCCTLRRRNCHDVRVRRDVSLDHRFGLGHRLGVSKPVITRALDSLGKLDLLPRRRDEADRRNVLVQRTVKGVLYLERLAETVGRLAKQV